MVLTRGRTYFEVPGCQRTHPSQELIAANTELLLRRGDYITPRTYITRIYQLRGDIMRVVNIHADFVMIQCTKNKNLTPLSHPLCHPAIRRGSNNVYSGPGVPPLYDENLIWYTPQASAKMLAGCFSY
jgi:hypothetical protein